MTLGNDLKTLGNALLFGGTTLVFGGYFFFCECKGVFLLCGTKTAATLYVGRRNAMMFTLLKLLKSL